jgi:hypothetical protein
LTATNTISNGFLTLWPHGSPLPVASNLNFRAGETRANRVAVKVGLGGAVDIYDFGGFSDVVLDVSGWFTDSSWWPTWTKAALESWIRCGQVP